MLRWLRIELVLAAGVVLLAACEGSERARTGFSKEPEASPVPVMVLKSDSSRTPEGYRIAELHVLLPPGATTPVARATLQHLIDSVAAADTMAAAVQVTGFVMSNVDTTAGTADVVPAIKATWGPIDSAGFTGAKRKSQFRTNFVLVRPLDGAPAPAGKR
jgi:hypothetical protein